MAAKLGIVLTMLIIVFAAADSVTAAQQTGRYVLKQTGDGFVRLDTETGSLAHCRQLNGKWQCESLDDANSGYRHEISRLSRQNTELKVRVTRLEARLQQLTTGKSKPKSKLRLPSDEELDEIMGFFEKLVMRFMQVARTLQDAPGEDI